MILSAPHSLQPLGDAHGLAQYAATATLCGEFAPDADVVKAVRRLADGVHPEFLAKTAIYAREHGRMQDLPAVLCAMLSVGDRELFERVFSRVIDDAPVLLTFVGVMRSGLVGRRSLGSLPKRLVKAWIEGRSDDELLRASAGTTAWRRPPGRSRGRRPTLADAIRMVRPRPRNARREALYGYLLACPHDAGALPDLVQQLEAFKADRTLDPPPVPLALLTGLQLTPSEWGALASVATWSETLTHLNTFARHGVFESRRLTRIVAERLRDRRQRAAAGALPYRILTAYEQTRRHVPAEIGIALQNAAEIAVANLPRIPGQVLVLVDADPTLLNPVSGERGAASSSVSCMDVAGFVAAAILRRNPTAHIVPGTTEGSLRLNPRDSLPTNARVVSSLATAAAAGLLVRRGAPCSPLATTPLDADLVIKIGGSAGLYGDALADWDAFKARNPRAKLASLDLLPTTTTDLPERDDVLHVGGFSDQVFDVIASFARHGLAADRWVQVIDQVSV